MLRAPLQRLYAAPRPALPARGAGLRLPALVLRRGRRRAAAQPLRRHLAGDVLAHLPRVGDPRAHRGRGRPVARLPARAPGRSAGCAASARRTRALAAWSALAGLPVDLLRFGRGDPGGPEHGPDLDLRHPRARRQLPAASWPSRRAPWWSWPTASSCASSSPSWRMRPVLADVSRDLPDGADLGERSVPLRGKLLIALPVINVVTGVVVAGLASDDPSLRALGIGVLVALVVAFTLSLRALGAAGALGRRADPGPARGDRARDRRRPGRARARARHRRDRSAGRVLQPDGRRPGGARAPARGVRRLRRPAAGRARARGGDGARGRGGRGDRPLPRHPRVHGLRRARQRERGRHRAQRLLRARRAASSSATAATPTSSSATGCSACSARPSTSPTTPTAAVAAAMEIAEVVRAPTAGGCGIGIGVNSGPVVAGTIGGGGRVEFTVIGDTVNTAARVEAVVAQHDAERVLGQAIEREYALTDLLRRPGVTYASLHTLPGAGTPGRRSAGCGASRDRDQVRRLHRSPTRRNRRGISRQESLRIPPDLDYRNVRGLSTEAQQKLNAAQAGNDRPGRAHFRASRRRRSRCCSSI